MGKELTLDEELQKDFEEKQKLVIFAEARQYGDGQGNRLRETDFSDQAYDWARWNPDYDTKIIPFYGENELDSSMADLNESGWLDEGTDAMIMGHSSWEGMFGGVMPFQWEELADANHISGKINKVVLGACAMGENPSACSEMADAFEAPVSAQSRQRWGIGAIPIEHRGSGSLEERTFAPSWGEEDYVTYGPDKNEALDIYNEHRPSEKLSKYRGSLDEIKQSMREWEVQKMYGGEISNVFDVYNEHQRVGEMATIETNLDADDFPPRDHPRYATADKTYRRALRGTEVLEMMRNDPRFDNQILNSIVESSKEENILRSKLFEYYESEIPRIESTGRASYEQRLQQ